MDTIIDMARFRVAAAAVTGARHLRTARNGQDAAVAWAMGEAAAVVVCDGCGSSNGSEVGARLGASLVSRALGRRLAAGESPADPAMWEAMRAEVVSILATVVAELPGDRAAALHEHFLFTIVAAAAQRDDAAVWLLGDGAYAFGGATRVIGPFAGNQPPYLAYDLLGDPQPAHHAIGAGDIVIATDGGAELELAALATARLVTHPDALRRHLAVLARGGERIDWEARRVVRTPATLQDDCAIGLLLRGAA